MKLHPNQIKMLTRHGWQLEDCTDGGLWAAKNDFRFRIIDALQECRRIAAMKKCAKYRRMHKASLAAYARHWRAANRDKAREIVNRSARKRRAKV
jgi:hypothetical protein